MAVTSGSVRDWAEVTAGGEVRAMRFRVLGPLEIEGGSGPVTVSGQRARALLTALLLSPDAVVSLERIVDSLWGENPPESPANAVQQVVARLRSRLGAEAGCVRTVPGGYLLATEVGSVDADEFEEGYRRARALMASDPDEAARILDEVLALWRGPAYGEFAGGFAQAPSVRLAELRTSAQEDRVELLLGQGAATDALAGARDLVGAEPLRERPVELLMRALHACGRVPDALDAYRRYRELLADELGLDPPAGLRELEARILQDDLPEPARPPGVEAVSPPPRRPVPRRPGSILGRDGDLELLLDCLGRRPLLTLVGPGGVGKTRLALEAAHRLADAGRPVFWADLTTVTPDRLLDVLAEATGTDMPRGPEPEAALGFALRGSSAVLCLDNAETVLSDLAPLVEALLEAAPHLRILATSRERLAVLSEHVHQLAPLPLPSGAEPDNPAIRLFLDRAPGLEQGVSTDTLQAIAELCRRLDGLPLAIELGASRAPSFGIREFTAQIAQELDLLAGGRRTAAARHQTVRAVVDASYRLLTPDEALVFERLAVFPGPFLLAQARTVLGDDRLPAASIGPLLLRLVEQSLVQSGNGRFWLLETLRTYAAELLSGEDASTLRARHAREVAGRVAQLRWQRAPDTEVECVAALSAMTPDLHQAWDHALHHDRDLAVELAGSIYEFAYLRQRRDLLDWGLQVADWDLDHPLMSQALATAATAAWARGDLALAAEIARRGLTDADGAPRPGRARSVGQAGNLAMFAGDFELAKARFQASADLHRDAGNDVAALMSECSVCQAMTYGGGAEAARDRLDDLRPRVLATRNPSAIAWVHYVTGEATAEVDPPRALASYRAAIEDAAKVDNRLFLGLARSSAVALTARLGSPEEALVEFGQVLAGWDEIGNVAAQRWVLMQVGLLLSRLGVDRPAALLAGFAQAGGNRTYMLLGDDDRLRACVTTLQARLDRDVADGLLSEGRQLSTEDALALARRTLRDLGAGR